MAISGHLETFSLPEVLQILERGQKTGRLTIRVENHSPEPQCHYIWLNHGRIVAAADRSDYQGLISMLIQRHWLNANIMGHLKQMQNLDTPLCTYLKAQGLLRSEQIKLLFHAQVLQKICALFKIQSGQFKFDAQTTLPKVEMTGLSLSASEAVLLGLRVLKDWQYLEDKLPDAHSALTKTTSARPSFQLDSIESKVWESADGNTPLLEIAETLSHSLEAIQRTAFRLIAVGLLEELTADILQPSDMPVENLDRPDVVTMPAAKEPVTAAFLQNLLGFLKSKV
ncbi:MAG TPA: DUF4388 domain-containing protein [Crinalium sp.]|jgi:hypothetical protein